LIWTTPTTAEGIVALIEYCAANGGFSGLAPDEWEDGLAWTIECAVCTLAGLPEPAKSDLVAQLWNQAFTEPIEPSSSDVSSTAPAAA
jgi:hypothetical protein